MTETDFGAYIEQVALRICGEPNHAMSKAGRELRFGSNGSLAIDLSRGVAYDNEAGQGGGTLWLIRHKGVAASDREAVEWLKAEGFEIEDRAKPNGHAKPKPQQTAKGEREVFKTFDYTDRDGSLLYQVCRIQYRLPDGSWERGSSGKAKKTFNQRRPFRDEPGVWIWGLDADEFMRRGPGRDWIKFDAQKFHDWKFTERRRFDDAVEHTLYRIPDLLDAMEDGRTIFVPEGEGKADLLWDLGVPATTNSGGAKHWGDVHAQFFHGADVVFLADNDDTGREGAAKKAQSVLGIAKRVRVLDLSRFWKEMRDKEDVVQWIERGGGDVEQLYEIAEKLDDWKPEPYCSKFGAIRWEDQEAVAERPYEFQIAGIAPRGETVLWYGESQSGKSFSAFDAGVHVATGREYQGRRVRRGGVVYCFVEKPGGARNRMKAFRQHHGIDLTGIPFAVLTRRFDIFGSEDTVDELAQECLEIAKGWDVPLDVIVIDTHDKATPGASEIDKKDISVVMSRYERLRDKTKAAPWIIGHSNAFGSVRGSLVLYNAIETVINVSVQKDKAYGEFRDLDGRVMRQCRVMKQSEGEAGFTWEFVLRAIEVGRNEFNEPITSCVVESPNKGTGTGKRVRALIGNAQIIFKTFFEAIDAHGRSVPPGVPAPPGAKVIDRSEWKARYDEQAPDVEADPLKRDARVKKALERAIKLGMDRKFIGVHTEGRNQWVWWTGVEIPGVARGRDEVAAEAPAEEPDDPQIPFGPAGDRDNRDNDDKPKTYDGKADETEL